MKSFKKVMIITGVFALFANTCAQAFDGAILKGIEINSPDSKSYRIIIKTDKDVPIKKFITATNKVVLDLENIKPAQFVNTLYNNSTEIDHVIVQPYSTNKLRIFLQGSNIAGGKIILDTRDEAIAFIKHPQVQKHKVSLPPSENSVNNSTSAPQAEIPQDETVTNAADEQTAVLINQSKEEPTAKTTSEPVFIDLSDKTVDKVKSVSPVASIEETSSNNFETMQNSMVSGGSENKFLSASPIDWALRLGMLAIIIIVGLKQLAKPKKIEINLASEKKRSKEMEILKASNAQKELLTKSLGGKQEVKRSVNASVSQYGIKEYQNSQLPPRKSTPIAPPQRPVNQAVNARPQLQPAQRTTTATKVAPKQLQQAQANFDGTKFLETMASIYQKSGRDDLAIGIRQNLIKKQVV